VERLKKKDNLKALNMFMYINREILQSLRFGEINHSAMVKILKSMRPQLHLLHLLTVASQNSTNALPLVSNRHSHDKSNTQSSLNILPRLSAQK
jgi:ribosomal protein L30/L7E